MFPRHGGKPDFEPIFERLSVEICLNLNHLKWTVLPSGARRLGEPIRIPFYKQLQIPNCLKKGRLAAAIRPKQ